MQPHLVPAKSRRAFALAAIGALAVAAPFAAQADDPFLRRTPTVEAVERVGPAVVNITTERIVELQHPFRAFEGDPVFERFFRDFLPPQPNRTVQSLGSGVIIDREGHVLTNDHVVERASRIRVSLADGREFDAELIGADPNNDVAVLRIETEDDLPWVAPGTSEDLLVGEPVIAIGNPFGLSHTVTTGVLSAVDRTLNTGQRTFHGFLQTDASINPGNSGGPLLNAAGSLVGINTAIYQGAQGIGFAIPIDLAKRVVAELIEHGEVQPVWVGLDFQDLDPALHEVMDLPEGVYGALVTRVREGGPGARAGIRRGDIVTHVDDRSIHDAREFFETLQAVTVGQELKLRLWRDERPRELAIVAEEVPPHHVAELTSQILGVHLEPQRRGGFMVTEVRQGSATERIGIRPGDIFIGVNGRTLRDEDELRRAVLDLRGRKRALVVVQRGMGRYHVSIPLA